MIKKVCIALVLVVLTVLSGCGESGRQGGSGATQPSSQGGTVLSVSDIPSDGTAEEAAQSEPDTSAKELLEEDGEITPYQFLNLFVGNAEEIAFTYKVKLHETDGDESGEFYRSGDKSVEIFTTQDSQGLPVTVRMLERDGSVSYIMDGTRTVKTYPSPTDDFLLTRMMGVAMSEPVEVVSEDGVTRYSYTVPFEQDEAITFGYVFYMKQDALVKMTYSVDGTLSATYEFSAFEQRAGEESLFLLPDGYESEDFDYAPEDGQIPPWWESDGLD